LKYDEFANRVDATDWDEILCVGLKGLAETLRDHGAEIIDTDDNSVAVRIEDVYGWLRFHRQIVTPIAVEVPPQALALVEKHMYMNARGFPFKVVVAQTGYVLYIPEDERPEFDDALDEDWSAEDDF